MFISVGSKDQTDHIRTHGVGLELACNGGSCRGISMSFAFQKIPHINLGCKLVPAHYRKHEYDYCRYWIQFVCLFVCLFLFCFFHGPLIFVELCLTAQYIPRAGRSVLGVI